MREFKDKVNQMDQPKQQKNQFELCNSGININEKNKNRRRTYYSLIAAKI